MSGDFEVIFLTASWCPHCKRLKEAWKPLFDQGIIKNVDIETEEGLELLNKVGVNYVPVCIVKKDGEYELCEPEK